MSVVDCQVEKTEVFDDVMPDLDLESIPPEVQEYAERHLGENKDVQTRCVQELQDIIYERGDVTPHRTDKEFLLRFLRARNYHVEASYRLFVNYHEFREKNTEYYKGINPLDLYFIGDADVVSVLPYREQNGRRILICRIGKWNPSDYSIDELFKVVLAILEMGVLEPRAQILGGLVIFDFDGFGIHQAWQITPSVATKTADLMGVSFPMKTVAIHVVNESWVFNRVFSVFKTFIDDRYLNLVNFHGSNMESLHNHIDPKYLPVRYGGIRPEYPYNDWFPRLLKNEQILEEMTSLGYSRSSTDTEGENPDESSTS